MTKLGNDKNKLVINEIGTKTEFSDEMPAKNEKPCATQLARISMFLGNGINFGRNCAITHTLNMLYNICYKHTHTHMPFQNRLPSN